MKVKILQESLNRGLGLASRIVQTHPSLPVLGNVLLEAKDNKLFLSATNLEVGMILKLKAQVLEEGKISVPARLLAEFINSLPPAEIKLELQGKTLEISTQTHRSTLNGIEAGEFPPLPQIQGEAVLKIKNTIFDTAINQVVFAAATDEGRPVLSGVLLTGEADNLVLVATDGFRLSHKIVTQKVHPLASGQLKYILPARGLLEVGRVLGEKEFLGEASEVELGLTQDQNQMIFKLSSAEISCRLLEGQFPDFKKIIPKMFVSRAILEREEISKAVKLASIFARDSANVIHFLFDPSQKKVSVDAQTKELGQSQTEIEGSLEGDPLEIAFNARFITEILAVLDSEQVSLELSGALSPAQIKAVGEQTFFHILMPIRTETGQ